MIKPLISEKSLLLSKDNKFSFICSINLSSQEIEKIITTNYKVNIIKVNRLVKKGKVRRFKYGLGKTNNSVIVIVTLIKGQKIDGFEFPIDSSKDKEDKGEVVK